MSRFSPRAFSPIAIVGRACVLPGAFSPWELWRHVIAGTDLLSQASPSDWGISEAAAVRLLAAESGDRLAAGRYGFVRGFERFFDPRAFGIEPAEIAALDPLFQWLLWGVQKTLSDAGHDSGWQQKRAGLVVGNLGYPSYGMNRFAQSVWTDTASPDPRNRFCFGLPPQWVARTLKLGLGGFSVDAACASSLYAIKICCDKLQDREADLMIAGGINRPDPLYPAVGFTTLKALSPTGQSRPLHRDADGLVPAEGAAFVALKRLDEAVSQGDRIHGVIRGIAIGNDGRSSGLLVPNESGQVRVMRDAYDMAGIGPEEISLVECHATGTPVGDGVELESMKRVFGADRPMTIGSLKSNLGHAITAAGAAGLIKVIEAIRAKTLPPTRGLDAPSATLRESRFRVPAMAEPWDSAGPRRAAVSAFGFGGNNAHLVVEEWVAEQARPRIPKNVKEKPAPLAVVGLGVIAGDRLNTGQFTETLLTGRPGPQATATDAVLPLDGIRFPPRDLELTLPQHLLLLAAAREALQGCPALDPARTGVFTAVEVDPDVSRHGFRWRLQEFLPSSTDADRERIVPAFEGPARVLGNMLSVTANRLNSQFDLQGPGIAVGAGEDSGAACLTLASRALLAGEIDAAIVGAVDLSANEIHAAALGKIQPKASPFCSDAAVVLVLRRLDPESEPRARAVLKPALAGTRLESTDSVRALFGDSYTAASLLRLAAAVVCSEHGCLPSLDASLRPWLPGRKGRTLNVSVGTNLYAGQTRIEVAAHSPEPVGFLGDAPPRVFRFSAADRVGLLGRLSSSVEPDDGPVRLAFVASGDQVGLQRQLAKDWLSDATPGPLPDDICFSTAPLDRQAAFVFGEASASYRGMGGELIAALPSLLARASRDIADPRASCGWLYEPETGDPPSGAELLAAARMLSRVHTELLTGVLGIEPAAEIDVPVDTPEFARRIEDAWEKDARIFVLCGPQTRGAESIAKILGSRPHVCVACDRKSKSPVEQAAHAAAALWTAGLKCNTKPFGDLLEKAHMLRAAATARVLRIPAHPPTLRITAGTDQPATSAAQIMQPAPVLPLAMPSATEPVRSSVPEPAPAPLQRRSIPASIVEAHRQALAGQVQLLSSTLQTLARFAAMPSSGIRSITTPPAPPPAAPALRFSRRQLEIHATGVISTLFGPTFRESDSYRYQVRMPRRKLLLVDRVTDMIGEPGSMGAGSIQTETDVRADSWFVHEGRMSAGVFVEAGQADLFLISYLGADAMNRGERKFRVLGCDLTWHGSPPKPGETLVFDIHIERHASHGDLRVFFYRYDCHINGELRLQLTNGQAGFFTPRQLTESAGILWNPEEAKPTEDERVDPPAVKPGSSYPQAEMDRFVSGNSYRCFGPRYEYCATHRRSPRTPDGLLRMLDRVTDLDPEGGPLKRGYLRAVKKIRPDDWYFQDHFQDDPCMPGTLMLEASQQALSFYLAALGFTAKRDCWRFEPVAGTTSPIRCRRQATPTSSEMVCEVFVRSLTAGPVPAVHADVLVSIDGVKAVIAHNLGMRLVPDWPMERLPVPEEFSLEKRPAAEAGGRLRGSNFIYACALGRPSKALGDAYLRFDGPMRLARIPAPPLLFISRVVELNARSGQMSLPAAMKTEFDLKRDAWFFTDWQVHTMPFCILLEAILQASGLLGGYLGCGNALEGEAFCRNLDGSAETLAPVGPDAGRLVATVTLRSLSRLKGSVLVTFDAEIAAQTQTEMQTVMKMRTVFGYFTEQDLLTQAGLPRPGRAPRLDSQNAVNLRTDARLFKSGLLDRITGVWPEAGEARLGRVRGEKDVDPEEYFFKAHFFQDPVMPGSFGIECMLQAVEFYCLQTGLDRELTRPRFETAPGRQVSWKYRGQVLPTNKRIVVEAEVKEIVREPGSICVVADGELWVDGVLIYQALNLSTRLVSGDPNKASFVFALDPEREAWIGDHRPNCVLPVMPMMDVANRLAQAAQLLDPQAVVTSVGHVRIARWIVLDRLKSFRASAERKAEDITVRLESLSGSDAGVLAECTVEMAATWPDPPAELQPLRNAEEAESPYTTLSVFHGPAFQIVKALRTGDGGATAMIDAGGGSVPIGLLHTALLDAVYHAIPQQNLGLWFPETAPEMAAVPHKLDRLSLFGETPREGIVRCEVRADGFDGGPRFPAFRAQIIASGKIWADLRLVEVLVPKGPFGVAGPKVVRQFAAERRFVEGVSISHVEGGATILAYKDIVSCDWIPGSVATVYHAVGDLSRVAEAVAVKEHVARRAKVHPSFVIWSAETSSASTAAEPEISYPVKVTVTAGVVRVEDAILS